MRTLLILLVVVGIAAGGAAYYVKYVKPDAAVVYRTVAIERGDLLATISATGTLEPEDVIDIGAQVAGRIDNFGPDPDHPGKTVDFNTVVHKGMLLANIDPTSYKAQALQAEASLESAKASLLQLEAKLDQAKMEWKRAEELRPTKSISDTDYDTAVANYKVGVANVAAGKAAIRQAEAMLTVANTNLGYTVIKSHVEGTVIARRVNVGQTVVASLNAPSIFLIAKDLRRMQVWASVNEADIGRIHLDMPVQFTVDAFPGEKFRGTVTQIRMNAQMTSNVVTYTVIVTTDNSSLRLYPYLTANVLFEADHREKVLLIPNAAFRWKPSQVSQIVPEARAANGMAAAESNGSDETAATASRHVAGKENLRRLWVPDGDFVRPLDVVVGITDGTKTEINGANVKEGERVVIGTGAGEEDAGSGDATSNPFLPKMPKGTKPPPPPG